MNNASKLSILAATVALIGGAAAINACTVSTGPITDVDGGTDSSVPPADGGTDTGVDSGCASWGSCPILQQVTFEKTGFCGACDQCIATSCCGQATTCFNPADCKMGDVTCACENDCIKQCDTTDGGAACVNACQLSYQIGADGGPSNVDMIWQSMAQCIQTNCKTQCGM